VGGVVLLLMIVGMAFSRLQHDLFQ